LPAIVAMLFANSFANFACIVFLSLFAALRRRRASHGKREGD